MAAKIKARVLKGFRDYLPETMLPKQRMLDAVAKTFESFGFAPLATPALEYAEVLLGKYGDEGNKLLYRFKDNGDRDVALRYDLTVPLARVVGMNARQLPMPFKRYQVAPVWRAENPGRGRFREFMQCDVDIIGSADLTADAECLAVGAATLTALGVGDFVMRINNRKLLTALLARFDIAEGEPALEVLRIIDKLPKIGEAKTRGLLASECGLSAASVDGIFEFLALKADEVAAFFEGDAVGTQGAAELGEVLRLASLMGVENVEIDLSIARGLDYYTGTIYETFLGGDMESLGSVMSGGRYDGLLSMFGGQDVPAVGISLGVDRLFAGLVEMGLVEGRQSPTQVLLTVFNAEALSYNHALAAKLRAAGITAEVYLGAAKLKKQFKYADNKQIPYVVIAGPDEIAEGKVQLKTLGTGDQVLLNADALVAHLS